MYIDKHVLAEDIHSLQTYLVYGQVKQKQRWKRSEEKPEESRNKKLEVKEKFSSCLPNFDPAPDAVNKILIDIQILFMINKMKSQEKPKKFLQLNDKR